MTTNTTTTRQKTIKLDDLIESGDLWVRNTTDNRSRRTICVNYVNRGGNIKTELIPDTPHPIHLSNRMTKEQLRESTDLRRYIQTKALTLVDPAEAEDYYEKRPKAEEAVNHAYAKILNAPSPISRMSMIKTDPNASNKQLEQQVSAKESVPGEIKSRDHIRASSVAPKVQMIVANYNSDNPPHIDTILMDLANIDLTIEDVDFVINNTKGALCERAKEMREIL